MATARLTDTDKSTKSNIATLAVGVCIILGLVVILGNGVLRSMPSSWATRLFYGEKAPRAANLMKMAIKVSDGIYIVPSENEVDDDALKTVSPGAKVVRLSNRAVLLQVQAR